MWHERYLACCNELAQWDTMAELGRATQDSSTLLESLWKLGDYEHLSRNLLHSGAVRPALASRARVVVDCPEKRKN